MIEDKKYNKRPQSLSRRDCGLFYGGQVETSDRYRVESLKARDKLSLFELENKSGAIHERFLQFIESIPNQTIFIYVSFRSEVDTIGLIRKLLESDRIVTVPLVSIASKSMRAVRLINPENDLIPGYFGILEPKKDIVSERIIDPSTIDIVVLPGSVFDLNGGRLGYGGGFYDRFLAEKISNRAKRIAFSFELQIHDQVPQQAHDQPVDYIISEERIIAGKPRDI